MALGIGRLTQVPPEADDWYAHAYAAAWNERYDELAEKEPDWTDCYGGNMSAPRTALVAIGGFAADLGAIEDLEIGHRLCAAGCKPVYLGAARGLHDDQKTRDRILHDSRRFGSYCVGFARRDPKMGSKLIGWFTQPTVRDVTLRRLFLSLRFPPSALVAAGRLMPSEGGRRLWYGFVSRYTFWLGVRTAMSRREWVAATRGIPVLMYHAFAEDGAEEDRFVVTRRQFERQMRLLSLLRFRVVPFERLVADLGAGRPLPRRAVAITIDDGYTDNLEIAAPILRRHRFAATIFLVSRRLGGENDWSEEGAVAGRPLVSLEQVAELAAIGAGEIRFGAHTRTHQMLTRTSDESLAAEVGGSRTDLEADLGAAVETLAYPYGDFDQRVAAATAAAGFLGACTVESSLVYRGQDPTADPAGRGPRHQLAAALPAPALVRRHLAQGLLWRDRLALLGEQPQVFAQALPERRRVTFPVADQRRSGLAGPAPARVPGPAQV